MVLKVNDFGFMHVIELAIFFAYGFVEELYLANTTPFRKVRL
jgi:hypothetical protein